MRILALNWQDLRNPQSGGAEVHLEEILRRLVVFGHQVDLLCCNFPDGADTDAVEGVRIYRRGKRWNFNMVAPFAIKELLRLNRYDVLIEDINKIPFYSPIYQKLPTLVVIPHLFSDSIFKEINFAVGSYIYLAEKAVPWVYRDKQFMVISKSTAEEVEKKGIDGDNIEVVECGIDKDVYRFDPSISKFEIPTLIYVGRLKKYKNIETPILAMKEIRKEINNARLIIIGSGDFQPNLQRLVSATGLDSAVEFKGFIPTAEKVTYLRKAHISVYPSLKEGWGLTNIEANACGTTVIASRVPGLKDSVDEGSSGLLFDYGNIGEFTKLAVKLLSNGEFRRSLEMGGLRWAANFSWDKTAQATENLLKKIIKAR